MALVNAAKNRRYEEARKILELNLEEKDDEYGGTALYWACVHGHIDIAKKLIDLGSDVNSTNDYSHTPLHAACDMGYSQIVNLLLDHGAKPDAQNDSGQTPMHLAAYRGYIDIIKALLKSGANQKLTNHRQLTPLQTALHMNQMRAAKLLHRLQSATEKINLKRKFCEVQVTHVTSLSSEGHLSIANQTCHTSERPTSPPPPYNSWLKDNNQTI